MTDTIFFILADATIRGVIVLIAAAVFAIIFALWRSHEEAKAEQLAADRRLMQKIAQANLDSVLYPTKPGPKGFKRSRSFEEDRRQAGIR